MSNHVEALALAWAEKDPLESWMLAVGDGLPITPADRRDIVSDYLADHDPFPDGTRVDVLRTDTDAWEPAVIIGRPGQDEWTVEYDDGLQAFRDHTELRPHE